MFKKLESLDQRLFLYLNGDYADWLDTLMYWVTIKYTWFPFYLLLIIWLSWRYKWQGVIMLVTMVAALGLADFVTSGLMKPFFERPRPCHEQALKGLVYIAKGCGGRYGFASSHASTTFALAGSMWWLLKYWSRWWGLAFGWASLVAYSRVYVGVHYPADILVGAVVGILVGWLMVQLELWLSRRFYGRPISTRYLHGANS